MIHFDDQNAGKLEKAINRAFSAFALIVFTLSLLATIAFVSQTGMFQPGARLDAEAPKLTASNWPPPILDNELINGGIMEPTPSPTAQQQAAARLKTPTPTAGATAQTTATPTQTPPPGTPFGIFEDALAPGWSDQSWGASLNFADTNPVFAGLHAIRYTATSAWAGLDLHAGRSLSTANYRQLRLALQATQANQQFAVYVRDAGGATLTKVPLANYGGTPPVGTWKVYTIPLSDLSASNISLGDVVIHEWSGKSQEPIFIDSIQLINEPDTPTPTPAPTPVPATPAPTPTPTQAPAPTPTPTPPPSPTPTPTPAPTPTPTVTPTPQPSGPLTIFADALAGGWNTSESWDAMVNPANGAPVYAGSKSISFVANSGWAGLQISNNSGLDTSRFTYLRFAIRATRSGEPFAVYLRASDSTNLTDPLPLAHYGGYPGANGWTAYTIPLADLNATNVSLGGIVIHDWSDHAQPAIYVDSIELLP
jgi:hypothetical protein